MEKIKEILRTKTIQQTIVTSASTVINGLLGVAFYVLVARFLGPNDFGILIVALTVLTMVADMAAIGTDTGIVKFVGKYFESDRRKALQFLKLGLEIKMLVGVIVISIGWVIIPFISTTILTKPELIIPLRLAMVGVFATLVFTFVTSSLQAIQKFWTWGVINVVINLVRLGVIIFLASISLLNINSVLIAYFICVLLGFSLSLAFLPNFFKAKGERILAKEFVNYNKWIALFMLIAPISGRLDTYFVTKFLSLADVGIYGVATGLSTVGSQIVAGISTVVAPKIAGMDSDKKAITYLKKLQVFTIGLAILGIAVGIPLSRIVIPLLYGSQYAGSIAPLALLIVAQAVFLVSIPAHVSVVFYFSYPKLFVHISIANVIIVGVLGWVLISNFGYMGAAATVLVGNLSNFIIPGIWTLRKFSQK